MHREQAFNSDISAQSLETDGGWGVHTLHSPLQLSWGATKSNEIAIRKMFTVTLTALKDVHSCTAILFFFYTATNVHFIIDKFYN